MVKRLDPSMRADDPRQFCEEFEYVSEKIKDIYIVYREGVYIQGIYGVFDNFDGAETCAILAMDRERDDYHVMIVIKMSLNEVEEFEDHPYISETRVQIIRRKNGIISGRKGLDL